MDYFYCSSFVFVYPQNGVNESTIFRFHYETDYHALAVREDNWIIPQREWHVRLSGISLFCFDIIFDIQRLLSLLHVLDIWIKSLYLTLSNAFPCLGIGR